MKRGVSVSAQIMLIGGVLLLAKVAFTQLNHVSHEGLNGEVKIFITASQVEFDPQNEIATYRGDVTVKQEDIALYADRIDVYLAEGGKKIELIKAYGNIKIVQEDKIISAQEGIYYHRERKVILTGNPTTRQGRNWITGDKIIYLWDEKKALIEGNVKATIVLDEEEEGRLRKEKVD